MRSESRTNFCAVVIFVAKRTACSDVASTFMVNFQDGDARSACVFEIVCSPVPACFCKLLPRVLTHKLVSLTCAFGPNA